MNPDCVVCSKSGGDPNRILVCDRCFRDVHMSCINMTEIPEGDYFCPTVSAFLVYLYIF